MLALLDTLAVKGVDVAGMVLGDEDDSDEEIPEASPDDDAPTALRPAADGGTGPGDAVPPATGTGDEERRARSFSTGTRWSRRSPPSAPDHPPGEPVPDAGTGSPHVRWVIP